MPRPSASSSTTRLGLLLLAAAAAGRAAAGPLGVLEKDQAGSGSSSCDGATVSVAAHPMSLYGLQPLASTQTPLAYGSPPTPTPVPGDSPACLGLPAGASCSVSAAAAGAMGAKMAAAVVSAPSSSSCSPQSAADAAPTATTSAACTKITGSYPTMTIPAFCHPSQHVNAPRLATAPPAGAAAALATKTLDGGMSAKVDCCAACAGVYNCVAWRFAPAYTQPPTPKLPGGFDPWGRGGCEIVYHTGGDGNTTTTTSTEGAALAVCPNGRVAGLLDGGSANPAPGTPQWANVYYNGWNEGACGQPADATTNSEDSGVGDKAALCPGQLDE